MFTSNNNELARNLRHDGIRLGEIIAYRAWRVIVPPWFGSNDDRLHSVAMRNYIWYPNKPAYVIRSRHEYGYDPCADGPLLFGKVKIWGEIVEHEEGYRSEFGKIVSLDYGDPDLLEKFRDIYRVNQVPPENVPFNSGARRSWYRNWRVFKAQ